MSSVVDANIFNDFVEIVHVSNTDGAQALLPTITAKHDVIGLGASMESTLLCTTVTARSLPEDDASKRAPVDIVVALDVSGSMTGRKLDLCKDTIKLLLRELSSQDRFGLVTFGDEANLEIPVRKLTKENKESSLNKVKSLSTQGCTNISGGIGLAARELTAVESPHEVRAVFLLTDGHANRGVADKKGIVELTKACLGSNDGQRSTAIHCFGYGSDHDQDVLSDISSAAEGGSYYFVDQDSDVSSAFGDALGGVLSVVAQNTVVKLKVPSEASGYGVSISSVRHDKAVKQADGSYHIDIGDFYAEESRDIIVETSLSKEGRGEIKIPHIEASISFLDTIQKKMVADLTVIGSIARPEGTEVSRANLYVALQCIRIQATEVMRTTEVLADSNQLEKAKSNISDFIKLLTFEAAELGQSSSPMVVNLLLELNTISSGLSSRSEYQYTTSKYMKSKMTSHQQQRCFAANEGSVDMYRSSRKGQMSKKLKRLAKK
mmetsp:Transcript_18474/g.26973  ORF Transcript_18474/g.26973 Transcript_18474/m.26973 type:complete len:492 (+) Transcript_18474:40-1515(+)